MVKIVEYNEVSTPKSILGGGEKRSESSLDLEYGRNKGDLIPCKWHEGFELQKSELVTIKNGSNLNLSVGNRGRVTIGLQSCISEKDTVE